MSRRPCVFIVEDDAGMRNAVSLLLRSAGFAVRCYPSAEAFLSELGNSAPVCIVVDVRLPEMDGIALFQRLVRLGTEPAAVLITGHADIPMAVAALKEGVMDFLQKPFDPGVLLDCVRAAARRAEATQERRAATAIIDARRSTLTPRETEVLNLLVEGHPNKVVATKLGMSTRTAEHHRSRLMEKMEARSVSQLIRMELGRHG